MSQVREIPGYYYDAEKRKYFKIQANAPLSSSYSSQDVKRRKIDDENKKAEFFTVQRNLGRIRRARILEAPLAGGFLSVEFGQSNLRAVAASVYAQNLIKTGDVSLKRDGDSTHFFVVMPQTSSSSVARFSMAQGHKIGHFFVDPVDWNNMKRWRTSIPFFQTLGHHSLDYVTPQISSMSANETNECIVTTWSGAPADRGIAISHYPPIPTNLRGLPRTSSRHEDIDQIHSSERTDIFLGPGTTRGKVDILSSTSAPPNSQSLFAIGSSKGILLIEKCLDMSWIQPQPSNGILEPSQKRLKDVFALAYCPNHKDILLAGERSGNLNTIDLRQPRFGPPAERVQHTSCIAHIKTLDEHRILVAGCASDLCQYDRRFIKPSTHNPSSNFRRITPTKPYLTYPDYRNHGIIKFGLDVDPEIGIIAAADSESGLKLLSLHGGQRLSGFSLGNRSNVECVKFVQDEPNKPKSLWTTLSNNFVRLSFDREETPSGAQDSWRSNLYDIHINPPAH